MHNAHLYIDDLKFPVKYLEYNFRQFTGTNNKPNTRVFGGEFSFTFDIDDKNVILLIEWMLSSTMQKNGHIEIMDFNQTSVSFKLEFANAYATSQLFHYDAYSNLPLQSNVTVTAGAMRVGKEVTYLQTWNPEDPFEQIQITSIENEILPEILESYYEDFKGNKINDKNINAGNVIYFNIKTLNANGKELSINLSNNKLDFEYNNKVLKDDILRINVSSDHMKIKLKTVKQ